MKKKSILLSIILIVMMIFPFVKVNAVSIGKPKAVATMKNYVETIGYQYDVGIDFDNWFLPSQEEGGIDYALIDGWELYEKVNGQNKLVYRADDANDADTEIDKPYSIQVNFVKARTFLVRTFIYNPDFSVTYSDFSDEIVLDHRTPNTIMMRVHNGKGCYSITGEGLNDYVCGERNHDVTGGAKVGEKLFKVPRGSQVTVKAIPDDGYDFDGWYGYDIGGGANSTSIIMMSDSSEYTFDVDNIYEETVFTIGPAFVETPKAYEVIEGANQNYVIDDNTEARFRIDADYSLFEDGGVVFVDDLEVSPDNYVASEGSTIVTLLKSYVDTLSEGEHILTVLFNDGNTASTKFTVSRNKQVESKAVVNTSNNTVTEIIPPATGVINPNTYDNVLLYLSLLVLSIIGFIGTVRFVHKRFN